MTPSSRPSCPLILLLAILSAAGMQDSRPPASLDWDHLIDATRRILDLGMPRAVQAAGGQYALKDQITTPDVLTAHFDFEACPVVWRHRIWGAEEYVPEVSNGIFLLGDRGTIFVTDDRLVLIPRGKGKERVGRDEGGDPGEPAGRGAPQAGAPRSLATPVPGRAGARAARGRTTGHRERRPRGRTTAGRVSRARDATC